jgi:hypothetical protein
MYVLMIGFKAFEFVDVLRISFRTFRFVDVLRRVIGYSLVKSCLDCRIYTHSLII